MLLATEQPLLAKALPVYTLFEREVNLRNLKERVDELTVSTFSIKSFNDKTETYDERKNNEIWIFKLFF